ncbi:MAG: S9 family peptidase, partial [Phenylobacterium sp.]|nr:S9 family peptidase [Phenylobacterium sp.]
MMRNVLRPAALAASLLLGTLAMTEARAGDDPFTWMEEIEGERALTWAKAENARSLPRLQNDPRYAGPYAEAQAIATAPDRIPGIALA